MSGTLAKKGGTGKRSAWASAAFVVESILLLVFLVAALSGFTRMFSAALNRSVESRSLDAASIAATSIAEHFAANPEDVAPETLLGDLRIACNVTQEEHARGTLYHADIAVYDIKATDDDKPIYAIETARYVNGSRGAGSAGAGGAASGAGAAAGAAAGAQSAGGGA